MIGTTFLANALCLPSDDWQALVHGRMITALPWNFLSPGQSFAIISDSSLAVGNRKARFWARCELCQSIDKAESLDILSKLTLWTEQTLNKKLEERGFFFLAYLRVYEMPQPVEVIPTAKGVFLPLQEPVMLSNPLSVLSDRIFTQRKHQLENLEPPEHPELEELHRAIAQLALTNSNAKALENDIQSFLGWSDPLNQSLESTHSWIQEIGKTGNSSDGDKFEKLVRRSFIELGFSNSLCNSKASLDPESSGGAGGIDIYCQAPYPLVGECKASKHEHVPNSVSAQLIHLGHTHLGKAQFDQSLKVLFVAGRLTEPAQRAAIENQMNVMRPETLEQLVTLKAKHPGAINLLDLKLCLEATPFGEESDGKVNQYIEQCWQQIKVRSHVINVVKKHLETTREKHADVNALHIAYLYSTPPQQLERDELGNILVELSSPLTGYLGRKKGSDGNDRFYFLRGLPI